MKATRRTVAIIGLIPFMLIFIKFVDSSLNILLISLLYILFTLNNVNMAEEKIITLNLRKQVLRTPLWKRSNATVKILREVLEKKTKIKKIKIDKNINEKIWSRSARNPETKLRIKVTKIDEESGKAELVEK